MLLYSLIQEPMLLLAWVVAIVIVLSFHEFAHALMATWLGDNTAKASGRLTLNPLSHVSGLGFLMLLLVGFGWGKPVPYNPYNLKYPRSGPALVALAGPMANLILAIVAGVALKLVVLFGLADPANLLVQFLNLLFVLSLVLMVFNLIPIPPLDGSKILFSALSDVKYSRFRFILEQRGPYLLFLILIMDSVFNFNLFSGIFRAVINWAYRLLL